jgi:hypothetical protein
MVVELAMRYSDNIEYLTASVIYLATQRGWWARTPAALSAELSLDHGKLKQVFEGFPGIFRKSTRPSSTGEHFFSLQARYAQRDDYGQKEEVTDILPLDADRIRLIYDFILKAADDERAQKRAMVGNSIAVAAAVMAALAAITSAFIKSL